MATSGSFNTSAVGNFYFTFEWYRTGYSSSANENYIHYTLTAHNTAGNYRTVYLKNLYLNGSQVFYHAGTSGNGKAYYDGDVVTSGDMTIKNSNDAGDGSFSASFEAGVGVWPSSNCSGSGTWSLDRIPRYGTSNQSLNSKTETTIKMNWSSDNTVDYLWYSTDNGSSWSGINVADGTSGTYTISGLSAYTTYKIKTRIRRKDSQLTTDSSALSVTTYDYPYCTSSPNFTVGNSVTMSLYNPLSRSITITIIGADGSTKTTGSYTGTSVSGFSNTDWQNFWYASIPNASSGTYKVKVNYGSISKTRNNGNTYSLNLANCTPTFSTFTYKDSNTDVTDVTNNDQVLVKGLSTLQVSIASADKMIANKSATAKNYVISIDTLSKTVDYSTDDINADIGTVTSSGTKRLNVRAYDSRNNSTLAYKDIVVYDYAKPVINASITRLNNFEAQTTIKINGTYTRLTIEDTDKNTITSVQYRYRESGGTWSSWVDLTVSITEGKFTCNDVILSLDNTKAFEFEIQVVDNLDSNSLSVPLDIGQAIFFISSNKKACYINGEKVPTLKDVYPVGSIYLSVTADNPSILFGGTWEQIAKGRTLVGVDTSDSDFSTVKKTGGTKTHSHSQGNTGASSGSTGGPSTNTSGSTALTVAQMPKHRHLVSQKSTIATGSTNTWRAIASGDTTNADYSYNSYTNYQGSGSGHTHTLSSHTHSLNSHTHTNPTTATASNVQPFLTCYIWCRTA